MYAILFLILFALVGVLICGWGLFPTLTSEWLVIDLSRGIYRGRRGVLFWHERLDGPLDDFEEVRIVDVPSEHDPNQRQSVRACDRWAELILVTCARRDERAIAGQEHGILLINAGLQLVLVVQEQVRIVGADAPVAMP
ncbi:MAG: hypothetical protein WBQ11_22345, partial [Isosphaeraceae bacterium]